MKKTLLIFPWEGNPSKVENFYEGGLNEDFKIEDSIDEEVTNKEEISEEISEEIHEEIKEIKPKIHEKKEGDPYSEILSDLK